LTPEQELINILTSQYVKWLVSCIDKGFVMARKRESAQVRRSQIIEAAKHCFQKKGYAKSTIDDIASEYGLSKGSIYWYYPSKRDILEDLFRHWMDETLKGVYAEISDLKTARDKLVRMGEFFIRSLIEDLELYSSMLVFWGSSYEDDFMRERIMDLYSQYDEIVKSLLSQGEKNREFSVPDKEVYCTLLIAMIEGLIIRQAVSKALDLDSMLREVGNIVDRVLPPLEKS